MRELMIPLFYTLRKKCPTLFDSVCFNVHQDDQLLIREAMDIHLCDGCVNDFATCMNEGNQPEVTFGSGHGNDNVIDCPDHEAIS